MSEKCCGNCRFWKQPVSSGLGECHRHSPIVALVVVLNVDHVRTVWPQVAAEELCGDHEQRPPVVLTEEQRQKLQRARDKHKDGI